MAVQVDTIESLLVANVGKYITDMTAATDAFKRFKSEHGATSTANDDTAIEQSAARQTTARRKQATDEAALAKTTADATKAAEKDKQTAIDATAAAIERARIAEEKFQATQSKRAETRFYAQGPNIFEAKAQEFSAADRLKDAQAAQVEAAAIREVAKAQDEATAAEARYYATGPKVFEAKAREFGALDRKAEAAAAREAAAAEAELTKAREAEAVATARLAELEARLDANAAQRVIGSTNAGSQTEADYEAALARREAARAALTRNNPIAPSSGGATAEVEVAAEREINEAQIQQISNQARLTAARGAERDILKDMNLELRLMTQYERAGLTTEEASIAVEGDLLAIEKLRAEQQGRIAAGQTKNNLLRFGEAAGIGRTGGGAAAIGGLVAGAAVIGGAEAVKSATDYAKALSDVSKEAGISTTALQVYQHAAVDAGAKSTDFDTALLHLGDSLGRARTGSVEQAKVFAALGVDIKNGASAGELLPTLIDRISSIADQSKRARVEVALFGEGGEKLDGLLSGGNAKVNELAAGLERTGAVLSSSDIAKLDDVSKKLEAVKAQLAVDIAHVVADNGTAIISLADSFVALSKSIGEAFTAFQVLSNSPFGQILSDINSVAEAINPVARSVEALANAVAYLGKQHGGTVATKVGELGNSVSINLDDAVQKGNVNNALLDKLGAPKPPKGPRGKSAEQLENERLARDKRFNDELGRLQDEQLKSQEALTGSIAQQAKDETELARRQLDRQLIDIEIERKRNINKGEGPAEANARAKQLRDAANDAFDAAEDVREQETKKRLNDADNQHIETLASIRTADLNNQLAIADTSKQRLNIELKLLAEAKEAERRRLNLIIANAKPDDPAIADANKQLAALDANFSGQEASTRRQNETPGQQYARSLKSTSDTVEDAGVNALKSLNSELDKSVESALHLHGIFGSIVDDLIDMAIKQALIKPLASAFFGDSATGTGGLFGGGSSGGGFSSFLGGLGKILGLGGGNSASAGASFLSQGSQFDQLGLDVAGFATGGSFVVGGNGGVDRNLMSINGKPVARVGQGETVAVIPQGQMLGGRGGPMTLQQTIQVDARNSVTPADFAGAILNEADSRSRQYAGQAGATALQRSPARVQQVQILGNN